MSDLDSLPPEPDHAPMPDRVEPLPAVVDVNSLDEAVVLAEVMDRPPLLWPTLAIVIAAVVGANILAGIVLVTAGVASSGVEILRDTQAFGDWVRSFAASAAGLALMVLPIQLTFFAVAMLAASMSREKLADRLGLRRGKLPLWSWPLFLLGTPVIAVITGQLMSLVVQEPSEQLQMLEDLFASHAAGSLPLLLLLISVTPGVFEELLFRGLMQRRLLSRLPAVAAIGLSTAFFAAAHFDPMHAIGVMPLGIWLGIIAWRADSIWPAVCGHVGNNAFAILASVIVKSGPELEQISPAAAAVSCATLLSFAGCLAVLTVGPTKRRCEIDRPLA